jgi:hypothetical protein
MGSLENLFTSQPPILGRELDNPFFLSEWFCWGINWIEMLALGLHKLQDTLGNTPCGENYCTFTALLV